MALTLTKRRRHRIRSAHELLGAVRRMLVSATVKVGGGDEDELAALVALHDDVDAAIRRAVDLQRAQGKSWAAIGRATGQSRQAAQQRFEKRRTA